MAGFALSGPMKLLPPRLAPPPTSLRFGDERRGSRHARGYGTEWDRTVKRIRARDCDMCQTCIREGSQSLGMYSAVDHRIPKAEGGSDDDANLEVICKTHHAAKTLREAMRGRR